MATNGGRQRKWTASLMHSVNLRPCLVHVPTGEIITSYSQLSRLVKKLGWKVFIDVSGNIWSAWYLPVGEACFIQMVFLPHPHISTATYHQLSTVVHAIGANTFNISYAPLRKFRELEAYSDFHKPTLRVRATGREIFSVRALTQILTQHGWRKESGNQFTKQETSERSPINLLNVIKIPAVENLHQLSTLDLEYIVLVTDNIFSLQTHSRFQPLRKQEGKPPRFPQNITTAKVAENSSKTTPHKTADETPQISNEKSAPEAADEISPRTTNEKIAPEAAAGGDIIVHMTAPQYVPWTTTEKTSPNRDGEDAKKIATD